jgi:hypothetical protein
MGSTYRLTASAAPLAVLVLRVTSTAVADVKDRMVERRAIGLRHQRLECSPQTWEKSHRIGVQHWGLVNPSRRIR